MKRENRMSTEPLEALPFAIHSPHNDTKTQRSCKAMDDRTSQLAQLFRAMANLLATHRANPYRIRAYRRRPTQS